MTNLDRYERTRDRRYARALPFIEELRRRGEIEWLKRARRRAMLVYVRRYERRLCEA